MASFSRPIQVRWSDIDANRHLRHSAYYDYGASLRMILFQENGLTAEHMEQYQIGPVLFREEAIFKREIVLEDLLTMDVELTKATHDYGRWSMRHNLYKNESTLAAIINIDAAWIDLTIRKLAKPNDFVKDIFKNFPVSPDFTWIEPSTK
jgi:acyl-CoA thioester hydrolase